jgi:uncharacterized repeat protein (TIGR03803 family)
MLSLEPGEPGKVMRYRRELSIVRSVTLAVALSGALVGARPAQAWTLKTLYSFKGGTDGEAAMAGLVRDPATGNLYGTTRFGGEHGYGTVFRVGPDGGETVLHSFTKKFRHPERA